MSHEPEELLHGGSFVRIYFRLIINSDNPSIRFSDTFLLRFPKEQKLCLELTLSGSLKDKGKLDPLMNFKAWLRIKKSD